MATLSFIVLVLSSIVFSTGTFILFHIASIERLLGWHFSNQAIYMMKVTWIIAGILAFVSYISTVIFLEMRKRKI